LRFVSGIGTRLNYSTDFVAQATIRSPMKYIHPAAILCFLLALAFYLAAWGLAAGALFVVGAVFELFAWMVALGGDHGDE